MSEREHSDWFWGAVSDFDVYNFTYDSLPDITRDAHLIVRGRVTGTRDGAIQPFEDEGEGPLRTRFGVVTIDEVLKGTPQAMSPGTILVARLGVVGATDDDLPEGEVILFLKNYAKSRIESGFPPSSDPDDRYYYSRPNGYQCVLRDLDGIVRIVEGFRGWEEHLGPYPSQLDGDSYNEVVERIRALAAASE